VFTSPETHRAGTEAGGGAVTMRLERFEHDRRARRGQRPLRRSLKTPVAPPAAAARAGSQGRRRGGLDARTAARTGKRPRLASRRPASEPALPSEPAEAALNLHHFDEPRDGDIPPPPVQAPAPTTEHFVDCRARLVVQGSALGAGHEFAGLPAFGRAVATSFSQGIGRSRDECAVAARARASARLRPRVLPQAFHPTR
jgi:hypothetical protein